MTQARLLWYAVETQAGLQWSGVSESRFTEAEERVRRKAFI